MANSDTSKKSWTQDITAYLLYLSLITTMGPLQFGFHLVPSPLPTTSAYLLSCSLSLPDPQTITNHPTP